MFTSMSVCLSVSCITQELLVIPLFGLRDKVTIEQETIPSLSNGINFNDLDQLTLDWDFKIAITFDIEYIE